jgi:hypothetical protein
MKLAVEAKTLLLFLIVTEMVVVLVMVKVMLLDDVAVAVHIGVLLNVLLKFTWRVLLVAMLPVVPVKIFGVPGQLLEVSLL